MYKITTAERMLQNLVVEYEKQADPRLPACSRKSGHLLETSCSIMDLKGVGVTRVPSVYGYVKQASVISQNYYPERLGKMYLVNAPWGFASVFSVVKGFLDPVTVAKIHVLGSGYQTELLAQVPKENLPKVLGGTCECKGSCMLSDEGPWYLLITSGFMITGSLLTGKTHNGQTPKNLPIPPQHRMHNLLRQGRTLKGLRMRSKPQWVHDDAGSALDQVYEETLQIDLNGSQYPSPYLPLPS